MELRFLAIFQEILILPTMKTIPVGRKWVHFFFGGGSSLEFSLPNDGGIMKMWNEIYGGSSGQSDP